MTIHIYDGLNVLRQALETDPMGRGPRNIVTKMLTNPGLHVWTFEGVGSLNTRRSIYEGYKSFPSKTKEGLFAIIDHIRELLKFTPAMQVAVPGFEADDVIAHLCQRWGPSYPIVIHSRDRDLYALCTQPNITFASQTTSKEPSVPPHHMRLFKTYVGDRSDTIPGVKGFGPKTWQLCDTPKLLQAHLELVVGKPNPDSFKSAGVPDNLIKTIMENADQLLRYWVVIGFFPIPPEEIDRNMVQGVTNPEAADALLRKFLQ